MLTIKTYGKLYIAGEYQVLNTSGNAILIGLNKYIYFNIKKANSFSYISRDRVYPFVKKKSKVILNKNNNNIIIAKAFETVFAYLNSMQIPIKPFTVEIISQLEDSNGTKYGFGSSSAIITGIIKAVSAFNNVKLSNKKIFKLSVLAQILANDISSGGDLAAAIYGGWIYYERYNYNWVIENIGKLDLINIPWPNLVIEQLKVDNVNVLAAWTKYAYKTLPLNKNISNKKYEKAYNIVNNLKLALMASNFKKINNNINLYNKWLKTILKKSNRYTKELSLAIKISKQFKLPAKISGAGGGDCAIILHNKGYNNTKLKNMLKLNDIKPFEFY